MGKAVPTIIFLLLMFVSLASAGTGELLLENDRFVIRYTAGTMGSRRSWCATLSRSGEGHRRYRGRFH